MSSAILLAVALIPAIVLCVYVFKKDRVEKEPLGLLLKLLLFGALTTIPAVFLEMGFSTLLDAVFQGQPMSNGSVPNFTYYLYEFFHFFFGVALVEEGVKFVALFLVTKNNQEFDCFFDGLIYAVFVSLGFAALENVLYVFQYGLQTGLLRAVTAVPAHMFFAVMMGYHYSHWHILDQAKLTEQSLLARGDIRGGMTEFSSTKSMICCLLVPTLAHGLYDYFCVIGGIGVLCLIAFVIFMYVHCFRKIKHMSLVDGENWGYARAMVANKYPEIHS